MSDSATYVKTNLLLISIKRPGIHPAMRVNLKIQEIATISFVLNNKELHLNHDIPI